jgi:branched-chain amino acid transport system ATP-binding protein
MNLVTAVTDPTVARLRCTDITVHFGGLTALDSVSFEVPAGQVVGVIGPNGAGKTTLFNVVCGFTRPQGGTLQLDGEPLRPQPHRLTERGIARTLQGLGLFDGQTVLENVMTGATRRARTGYAAALLALPRADRDERALRDRATQLLEEFGLGAVARSYPSALPYGVRKRVALARALVSEPRLLLLDEPAGGLGTEDIAELAELISTLPARTAGGCSVMLVEHHVDLVMQVCDALVVLDFGKVIAAGTPTEIRASDAVAEAYLGADVETAGA